MPPVRSRSERAALKEFGGRVRARRLALGLTQEQLGHRAKLDRTYIAGIEQGTRNVGVLNLLRLVAALDWHAGDLVGDIYVE